MKIQYDASKPENHGNELDLQQCPVCNNGTAHVVCLDGKIRFSKLNSPEEFPEFEVLNETK